MCGDLNQNNVDYSKCICTFIDETPKICQTTEKKIKVLEDDKNLIKSVDL